MKWDAVNLFKGRQALQGQRVLRVPRALKDLKGFREKPDLKEFKEKLVPQDQRDRRVLKGFKGKLDHKVLKAQKGLVQRFLISQQRVLMPRSPQLQHKLPAGM